MNPSNDNGLNFFEPGPIGDGQQHQCRDVDMNNNCACVTNHVDGDDTAAKDINDGGDKLVYHLQQVEPPEPIDPSRQLPALLIRLTTTTTTRIRARRRKMRQSRVVTIDKLIRRISALSRVATTGTGNSGAAIGLASEEMSSRLRLTGASKAVQDRRILRI
ncbi:uncharacterized protein LOC119767367 [Culex quinquefasciatus]|uniref:uncharacterized protein LOC119767367 n=1 Tax=Culex quinquefasciatus TaxID=7176 RepID=UPI0018E32AB3|nr:uncharacterized protein LOC119767367 [Culex quinquefasciatus]